MLVYTVGLDTPLRRALQADLPGARFVRLRPVDAVRGRQRRRRPHLLLLDAATNVAAEVAAARAAWGDTVVIVALDRRRPVARVWCRPNTVTVVEPGPGFLRPFLSAPEPP